MSLSVAVNQIPDEDKTKINDVLQIKMEDKYSFGPPRYFIPYHITEFQDIKLPFAFAVQTLKYARRKRTDLPSTEVKFEGELRPEQKEVKTEAIAVLNKMGSVILSMYCGFGKTITSINLACSIGFLSSKKTT